MNTSVAPVATLGRDLKLDEVTLSVMRGDEGWQKTVYDYDTWVGETVLVDDGNLTGLWRLAVSASDPSGLTLDGSPVTIAVYRAGANHWDSYEDAIGNGNSGGIDTTHNVGPGVRGDYPSILVATPGGGERLAAGDDYIVAWTSPTTPGFTQSLSLSTDSGFSFAPLTDNIPADAQRFRVTMPGIATTRGRIRLLAIEPINHNFMAAVSTEDFSIGVNVGSNVDVSFVSSEKIDLNWVDMSTDEPPNTTSGASRLIINLTVKNRGSIPIASPFLRVSEMNRHVMLTRDPKSRWTEGARFYIDAGSDNTLSPGETANARLAIGLINGKKFFLSVNVYGVPDQPIVPASAADIWSGKPRTR
jgi:hypothetical protein